MAQASSSQTHKEDNPSFLEVDNASKALKRKRETSLSSCEVLQQKGCPWMFLDERRYSSGIDGLHEEIDDFFKYITPTPTEIEARATVVNKITEIATELWPFAAVHTFGSYANGIYLPTSDIDIMVYGKWKGDLMPLYTMEKALNEKEMAVPNTLQVVPFASVPIVKLTDKYTNLDIDIGFNGNNRQKSVDLIKLYSKLYPNLKCLVLVLKEFLIKHGLNEVWTGGLSSYTLILMTISFFQLHPRSNATQPDANLGVLLIEFFELYGWHFRYETTAIVIRQGGKYLPKWEFEEQMRRDKEDETYSASLLAIQDPLNTANDVAQKSWGARRVKKAFQFAYLTLTNCVDLTGDMKDPNITSILGRIIRVTDAVIEHRQWIRTKFSPAIAATARPQLSPVNALLDGKTVSSDPIEPSLTASEENEHVSKRQA